MKLYLVLLGFLAALLRASAADWPQWRGAHRDGLSPEQVNSHWPAAGPTLLWRAAVGTGFSSVSVSDGRAFTLGNTTNHDTVWCFDALSGKELWRHSYPAQLGPQYYEGGPGATPIVDRNRVFTLGKWGDLFCLDAANGTVIWQHDLRKDSLKPNR